MRGRLVQTLVPMLMAAVLGGGCGGDEGGAPPADTALDVTDLADSLADTGTSSDTNAAADVETDDGSDTAAAGGDAAAGSDGDAGADETTDAAVEGGDASVDSEADARLDSASSADATGDGDATTADSVPGGDAAADGDAVFDASVDVADGGDVGPKKCSTDAECDNLVFCDGVERCDPTLGDPVTGCRAGTPPSCNDGASCTVDSCNEATKSCTHTPQHAACDDAQFCNGAETCDPAKGDPVTGCAAGSAVDCDDGVACTTDSCSESSTSCTHVAVDSFCDNGMFCDGAERCDAILGCVAGAIRSCDDSLSCTVDTCNTTLDSCVHTPVHTSCADGFYCSPTGPSPTGCVAGTPSSTPSAAFGASCERCDEVSQVCR